MQAREVAKFFSGLAANQVMTHGAFAVAGTRFTLMGIDYTPGFNAGAAVFWLVVTVVLVRYAWRRTPAA